MAKASLSCKSICQWVLALEHYHDVFKMVKPKQKRVEEAKEALNLAQSHLQKKQSSLKKVCQLLCFIASCSCQSGLFIVLLFVSYCTLQIMDHLEMLQNQYQDSVNQQESLKERKKTTALRLERASVLIHALADEKVRFDTQAFTHRIFLVLCLTTIEMLMFTISVYIISILVSCQYF